MHAPRNERTEGFDRPCTFCETGVPRVTEPVSDLASPTNTRQAPFLLTAVFACQPMRPSYLPH